MKVFWSNIFRIIRWLEGEVNKKKLAAHVTL